VDYEIPENALSVDAKLTQVLPLKKPPGPVDELPLVSSLHSKTNEDIFSTQYAVRSTQC